MIHRPARGVAKITINREKVMNAFRGDTVEEMIIAFRDAETDPEIGVIVLAGAGDRAFCTGGDQSTHSGKYIGRGVVGIPIEVAIPAFRASSRDKAMVLAPVSTSIKPRLLRYVISAGCRFTAF